MTILFIVACIVTGSIMTAAYDFFFPSNKSYNYKCISTRCKSQNITVMRNNGSVIMLTCNDCNKKWRL